MHAPCAKAHTATLGSLHGAASRRVRVPEGSRCEPWGDPGEGVVRRTPIALIAAQRCPKNPPQMRGIHVTGLVSCTRIFQMSVSSDAPFMPSSWRAALSLLSFFSSVACWLTALRATRPVRVL